jgi:hypothetical protein
MHQQLTPHVPPQLPPAPPALLHGLLLLPLGLLLQQQHLHPVLLRLL